ncbi:MAG: hypothetical protein ACI9XO_003178 [Paraglaciecola sp.]|jgi:hypothetical protein
MLGSLDIWILRLITFNYQVTKPFLNLANPEED